MLQSAVERVTAQYLDRLSVNERREGGRVYTPPHLVRFILRHAGYVSDANIEDAVLIDPACGAGAFLQQAVLTLAARVSTDGANLGTVQGRQRLLSVVGKNLYGIDVDPIACDLARRTVRETLQALCGDVPPSFFDENIVEADFLAEHGLAEAPSRARRDVQFVVGNPPYVSATRIATHSKEELRSRYQTATGRLDLYTVFFERALALLTPGGFLAFVTPDKYLVSQSGQALRTHILGTSAVRLVAQFASHKVFPDAATVPCVTVLEKGGQARRVEILQCGDRPTSQGDVEVLSSASLAQSKLGSTAWQLQPSALLDLARSLMSPHKDLESRTERISAGPATGRDGIYVFSTPPDIEAELLRPAVRGRDIDKYKIADPDLTIALPYSFDEQGRGSLIDLRRFPRLRRHLESHRVSLEARHCVRVWEKAWYDLHDQAAIDLARREKILVPDVAEGNRFAVDGGRFLPLHSAYYLLPRGGENLFYLVGVLNSSVCEFLIRLLAPRVKDGFSRYRRQFLATLPIPVPSLSEIRKIADAAKVGNETRVDELVYSLFRLTPSDQRRIARYLETDRLSGKRPPATGAEA